MEKANPEFVAMIYGSLVTQLLKDYEDMETVNEVLGKMGESMGSRLVEEFFAKSQMGACADFPQTMHVLATVACKMFLGVTARVTDWNAEKTVCKLILAENPLIEFVELPQAMVGVLRYSNLLCGIIRGALEQLYMRVECSYTEEMVAGGAADVIRVELCALLRDEFIDEDDGPPAGGGR